MRGEMQNGSAAPERFNFGDSGHVTPEQLRTLRSLDELLARNLTHALSAWLRTGVNVSAEAQTQMTFQEFLEGGSECYLLPVHLPEVHATGLLRFPLPLAAHMIEFLLGGSGSAPAQARELTEIEDEIFQAVLSVLMREWNAVWQQIALQCEAGERSRNSAERQLLSSTDKVFCFHMAISTAETSGQISLCLPSPVLASIMRRTTFSQSSARGPADTGALLRALDETRVRAGLCFPAVRVSAARLAQVRVGYTLVLPLPSNAAAEFRVSEVPVGSAAPVRLGAWRAANVSGLQKSGAHRSLPAYSSAAGNSQESATYA